MRGTAISATPYTGEFRGEADQVGHVRREVARYLTGCPAAEDATLVVSELVTNAGAPRGALSYPRCSREELEGGSWV